MMDTVVSTERSMRPEPRVTKGELDLRQPLLPQVWQVHPYFSFMQSADSRVSPIKIFHGKELLFYVVVAMLMVFALLRNLFAKYFSDLFRVFFRTTMKQRQIKDQLMQTPLPSLAFNIFYVASAGLYLSFVLYNYAEYRPVDSFWLFYMYASAGLIIIYLVKYIALKIVGWIFNVSQAADSYIFIVFIINKVIGVFLLPFNVLLAFTTDPLYSVILLMSWVGLGGLFLYRFILGLGAARNEVKFNIFHFLIYMAAFEVAPLVLVYRVLMFRV